MSFEEYQLSPTQYIVENLTKFSLLDFVTYFDFESEEDVRRVLMCSLNNALKLSKIREDPKKVELIERLKENVNAVSEITLRMC